MHFFDPFFHNWPLYFSFSYIHDTTTSKNFRVGSSSLRTRTRTQCTQSATSARCCRSRNTRGCSPLSRRTRQLAATRSGRFTTSPAPTILLDSPSTSSLASSSPTLTRNEGQFFCREHFSLVIANWTTYKAPFKKGKAAQSLVQKSLNSHFKKGTHLLGYRRRARLALTNSNARGSGLARPQKLFWNGYRHFLCLSSALFFTWQNWTGHLFDEENKCWWKAQSSLLPSLWNKLSKNRGNLFFHDCSREGRPSHFVWYVNF